MIFNGRVLFDIILSATIIKQHPTCYKFPADVELSWQKPALASWYFGACDIYGRRWWLASLHAAIYQRYQRFRNYISPASAGLKIANISLVYFR